MSAVSDSPTTGLQLRARVARDSGFALDVDTQLAGQGITAVFGPSGCGKTTLLRAVAGLTRPSPGRVVVKGQVWQDDAQRLWLPTHRRPLGMVFQEASLFEHLSVQGNLDFGMKRVPAAERRLALEQAIELLGIGHLLARQPAQLSGGERQRVAIARALATSPRLLLMDEPLASLDAARKSELLPYFERLQRTLDIPVLYVTHSLDEVARLASEVLLLNQGSLLAQGPTADILTRLDLSLTRGDAARALIAGHISAVDAEYGLITVQFDGGNLQCVAGSGAHAGQRAPGQPVRLVVHARDVSLSLQPATGTSVLNLLPATVRALSPDGPAQTLVALQAGNTALLARITRKSADALALECGQQVWAQVKGVAVLD